MLIDRGQPQKNIGGVHWVISKGNTLLPCISLKISFQGLGRMWIPQVNNFEKLSFY